MKLFSELVEDAFPRNRFAYCFQCKTECIDDFYIFGSLICPVCNNGYCMHCGLTMDELEKMKNEKT